MCDHKNCYNDSEVHIEFNIGNKTFKHDLCKKCAKSVLIQGLANNIGFELKRYILVEES